MRLLPSSRIGIIRLFVLVLVFAVIAIAHRDDCWFLLSRIPLLYRYFLYSPREGDIVFQSLPHSDLVDAIEGTTHSPYSHCGVVLRDEENRWVVIESVTNVHETPLLLWLLRGRGGNFAAYRLDPRFAPDISKFKAALLADLGQPYDFSYDMKKSGAFYCSDLVYLAFQKATGEGLGAPESLRELDWQPYRAFITSDAEGKLPLDRVMITPVRLSRAPQLHKVYGY